MFEMSQVGINISRLRKAAGLTQVGLADKMGVSFQAVSNWERGVSMPDISKLGDLAALFAVSIDEILGNRRIGTIAQNLLEKQPTPDVSIEEATEMGPFLHEEEMDTLLDGLQEPLNDADLAAAAPFVSEDFLHGYAQKLLENGGTLYGLTCIAPFLRTEYLDGLVRSSMDRRHDLNEAVCLLPFISSTLRKELAQNALQQGKDITMLAPFLNKETLTAHAKAAYAARGISGMLTLAPFLDEDVLAEIAADLCGKNGLSSMAPLLPFLRSKNIEDLLRARAKGAQTPQE